MDIMDMPWDLSYETVEPVKAPIQPPDHNAPRNASGALIGHSEALSLAKPRRKWPVTTHHSHPQLRSLLHFSPDCEFLYFVASAIRDHPTLGRFWLLGGGQKTIAKLCLSSGEVTTLAATSSYAIHCFAVKYGFIAYCTSSGFAVYHEESDTMVHHEEHGRGLGGSSQPNNLALKEVFGRVLLVIMCNGGVNPSYEIVPNVESVEKKSEAMEDEGAEERPKKSAAYRLVPFEDVRSPHSLNYAAFGEGAFYNTLLAAPDACTSPVFFEIDEESKMVLSSVKIVFAPPLPTQHERYDPLPDGGVYLQPFEDSALYDSMMAAWWGATGICALGLEQGYCVVLDWERKQTLAVITNAAESAVDSAFAENGHIRIVSFAPDEPILLFAESKEHLHLVDLRTWQRQIVRAPASEQRPRREISHEERRAARERDMRAIFDMARLEFRPAAADGLAQDGEPEVAVGEMNGGLDGGLQPLFMLGEPEHLEEESDNELSEAAEDEPRFGANLDWLVRAERDLLEDMSDEEMQDESDDEHEGEHDELVGPHKAEINGLAWRPNTHRFYVAYAHCIQEYELTYGVPTLRQLAIDAIVGYRDQWATLGWTEARMPPEVLDELRH